MLEKIKKTLDRSPDVKAWIIRHEEVSGAQQYDLKDRTEAVRETSSEIYNIDVLCDSKDSEGNPSSGLGTVSILPGGEIEQALEKAIITAKLVHNQPYDFAEPAPVPELDLVDQQYLKDPASGLQQVLTSLKDTTAKYPHVRMTTAECFGQEKSTHLVSSKGMDARQRSTEIYLQWVYIGGSGDEEVETYVEMYRRQIADLKLEEEAALRAQYTSDLLAAGPAPDYSGPVFVQGSNLAAMIAGAPYDPGGPTVIQTLSSAGLKYTGETPWEIGKSIFREEVKGETLQMWANRQLPYGIFSSAFDAEGIPAQRVPLVQDNHLGAFWTDQRYASYLDLPLTGSFGNLEMPAGKSPQTELQQGKYIEIAQFSWFHPDYITGDFSSEIRLGYLVENGEKRPFRGGLLVGNLLDALADVRWSSETGFYGNYLGPKAARFNNLQVAG
jgi:predicted Zn-dependent protease